MADSVEGLDGSAADSLAGASRAMAEGRWDVAREGFEAALVVEETPEAQDGLGQALWFLGKVEEAIGARASAFEGFMASGRYEDAARVGVWVSNQHRIAGRASAARGWLARAERSLARAEPCVGHGWVAAEAARHAEDADESAELARRAMAIARESGARDLEVLALSLLGEAEVAAGRREEGMRLLEEAMAAAGDGRDVHTIGEAYCSLLKTCATAGEWERAIEWCAVVDEFARGHEATPLLGACRTVHADVLMATGRWADAERALESALGAHARFGRTMGTPTSATLAELRVRQGRLAEAEQLLANSEEDPYSLRALALLRLAGDEPQLAAALLERGLTSVEGDVIPTAQLLAPLVDACLASGDVDGASAAAGRLDELARTTRLALVEARADLAAALAMGRADEAAEPARRALAEFSRLGMALDNGEARIELARALAGGAPELAEHEARTALKSFRELGASRAMDLAAAVLRELGAGTAPRSRSYGELTAREREVLALLGQGMSNTQIGKTLFISERTAGHHVSRILSKLGVRNRAEAAVHAVRAEHDGAAK
jgi:ATP/maltotriose-dependent transcriptional regulator MalT